MLCYIPLLFLLRRCQFLQTITAILSLLYHFGHFHVYVEFEEEAETRYLLWKWLCCGCCRKRPSYLFESLQEGDAITTAITTRYTPPPGFTGHNDLYESCRTDGCPRHSVSTNNEMRDLQCLYKGMPQTQWSQIGAKSPLPLPAALVLKCVSPTPEHPEGTCPQFPLC